MKTNNLLTQPPADTVVSPIHTYNDEQLAQIESLRKFAHNLLLPDTDPYHPWEHRFLTRPDTIPRYMRAAKWNLQEAEKRIKATLEWRREFKPDIIPPEDVRIESETGKIILSGFDKDGRPIIYMRPGRENTETSPRQLRHLVWILERAKDLMPPGQESLVIIVDYKSTTLRTNPSISVARKVLHILQQHYVETLGRAIVVNLPRLLSFFYKGISPFLDPVTRDKMRFNPDLLELIHPSQLDSDFGGEWNYEFEPTSYWNQLITICGIVPDGTRTTPIQGVVKQESETKGEATKSQLDMVSPVSSTDTTDTTTTPNISASESTSTNASSVPETEANEKIKNMEDGLVEVRVTEVVSA